MISIEITTNKELAQAVNTAIADSGYTKSWIAEQMGITKQGFTKLMSKQNFSIDDANKILFIIGYKAIVKVVIKKV